MRKLIELSQEHSIECDNPTCDFTIDNPTRDPNTSIEKYINVACPRCEENLLTEKDYRDSVVFMKRVNWLNKWFSWLTLLNPNKKYDKATVHVHKGINIKIEDK